MKIEHIAIWTSDLEHLRKFYTVYFNAEAGSKYVNSKKEFQSYFLRFDSGARLEIMQKSGVVNGATTTLEVTGLAHFAMSVGSAEAVDQLTKRIGSDGYHVHGQPRWTGDGYYESVVLDPDGNRIEITI